MKMQPGQNAPLPNGNLTLKFVTGAKSSNCKPDFSCFALTEGGKTRHDQDFIFFNNRSMGQAISLDAQGTCFVIDPIALPGEIVKVAFCMTLPGENNISSLSQVSLSLNEGYLEFALPTSGRSETAIVLCEMYRRNGEWKVRALGQGFNGGLQPLAKSYGISNSDSLTSRPTPASPKSVSLSKITLEKSGDKISLEKKGGTLGEVVVNLNWQSRSQHGGGFLSSLFGGGNDDAIDLDLGCLFELKDGRKGAVQALGESFGSFHEAPYIELDGDDRTGNSAAGETMRINGRHWDSIRRVIIYAFIYDGAPAWDEASARVSIKLPNQPEILVNLDNHSRGEGMCAIALLENVDGALQIRKDVKYFSRGHSQMDQAYKWGLRWVAGSK